MVLRSSIGSVKRVGGGSDMVDGLDLSMGSFN